MGAMGTHHSDFKETEEAHDDGDPNRQRPSSGCEYPCPADEETGETNEEKVDQLLWTEMAVNHVCNWAVSAVGSFTSGNWFRWVIERHANAFLSMQQKNEYKPRLKPKQNGSVIRDENIEQQQATNLR
jgi:hypothetical protein